MGNRERSRASAAREDDAAQQVGLPRPRSVEKRDRRSRQVRNAPRNLARSFVELPKKVNPLVTVAVVLVVAFVALSVATPLRNYFQQEAELAEVNAKIQDQREERDRLEQELDRYESEAYIREQARTRLGVVDPGESAFRLMDPKIDTSSPSDPGTEEKEEEPDPWYSQLWGSVATPPEDGGGSGKSGGSDGSGDGDSDSPGSGSGNLPIDPEQPEEPAQEGDQNTQRDLQNQQQEQQQGAQ